MIPVEQYLEKVLSGIRPLEPTDMPVDRCLGLTLAEDITARYPVPPFSNSAMDGYAVRAQDLNPAGDTRLPVAGDIPAGDSTDYVLQPGTAMRIMTGARVPEGADTVVMVENTDQQPGAQPLPDVVTIHKAAPRGKNVRYQGEDCQVGDAILQAGDVLTPAALSSAVSVGYGTLHVYPRPRIAIIATGSELRPPGQPISGAQIPDSNSTLMAAMATRSDCNVVGVYSTDDTAQSFADTLTKAADIADVIITSGGVSAGAYDVVKEVGKRSDVYFTKVAMQPGKPQGCGVITGESGHTAMMVSLPGNPVSVFVSYHMFVRPVLAALTRRTTEVAPTIAATTTVGWSSPKGKRQFVPVHLDDPTRPGETPTATPTHMLGSRSHLVASLHLANALAIIPEDVTEVGQWSVIDVMRV